MGTVASVFIDENEITPFAIEGSATHALNRPGTAQIKVPMTEAIGGVGSLLKIYFTTDGDTPWLFHHGRVLLCETTVDQNYGYVVYNSTDATEMWKMRPVRDADGDFSFPSIIKDYKTGPQIIKQMIINSEDPADMPDDAEGPLFLKMGTFETGGTDLSGAPQDWPMTMASLASLLVSTGELDIVITPIELEDSTYRCDGHIVYNYNQIDCYNGRYGTDRTGSVFFQYGMGLRNIDSMRWNEDMTNMTNKLWYYLGPVQDDFHQHWAANITGDDQAFNSDGNATGAWGSGNSYVKGDVVTDGGDSYICIAAHTSAANSEPGVGAVWHRYWTFWMTPPGGRLSPTASATNNQIGVRSYDSRCTYGVRMDIQLFDDRGDEATVGHDLYRRRWQIESWLRAAPINLVHITPSRDTAIGTFDIGDLVLVEASADVRGGFSDAQRVYEYTIAWDVESVPAISELQCSPGDQGFD